MNPFADRLRKRAQAGCGMRLAALLGVVAATGPVSAQQAAAPAPASPPQAPAGSVGGMGDINLFPKRVVISGRDRIATVGLYNKVPTAGEYEIQVTDMAMLPDGQIVALDKADAATRARVSPAGAMLRWSPRRILLQGNEAQTVRIMARTPPDLPAGEYRAHFMAIAVPPPDVLGNTIDDAAGGGQGERSIGVRIVPRFGISIPVIVRVGSTTLNAGLRDISVVAGPDGSRAIALTITRAGTRSAFGDLVVTAPGAKKPVAQLKGIGVYTELASRQVTVPIDPQADPRSYARGARLTVSYIDDDAAPGQLMARQEFTVP